MLFSKEQIFLVTGASSGIGRAAAIMLNSQGACVVGVARNRERLEETKRKCNFPDNFFAEEKDLTQNINNLPQYVKALRDKYGRFSGMAYCAGIAELAPVKILEYDKMKTLFDIDYFAPIFMTKGIVDKRNNAGKGTSIVVISSYSAYSKSKGMTTYAGAKSALITSMKIISKEVVNSQIRINTISPSDVKTPLTQKSDFERPDYEKKYPFGFADADDVANLAIYLLSDKAKQITGQDYIIDCNSEQ